MRIKIHNSLAKKHEQFYLLDNKIHLFFGENDLFVTYRIDEISTLFSFNTNTKEFRIGYGFGRSEKSVVKNWWENYSWKEVSK